MDQNSEIYFPHDGFRKIQSDMVEEVSKVIKNKKNLIVHAPTGLGKTAASIAPALTYALKNKKTIFFLTSRHTQHKIAVETLKNIRTKYNLNFSVVDIIGKKHMCLQPGIEALYSGEFSEYCKAVREDGKCEFYVNTKNKSNKLTFNAQLALEDAKNFDMEELMNYSRKKTLCPYELSVALGRDAKAIICDYYYIFNPAIREMFLTKTSKELDDIILIIDEAHNLPFRVRELMTENLSNIVVKRAIKEASKYGYDDMVEHLQILNNVLKDMASSFLNKKKYESNFKSSKHENNSTLSSFTQSGEPKKKKFESKQNEKLVKKEDFLNSIKRHIDDYEQLVSDLEFLADEIREKQKVSYLGSVANFLELWLGEDEGFARILSLKETDRDPIIVLSYRCLDPSLICRDVVNGVHSSIVMSGTLVPVQMYHDLLGLEDAEQKVFDSPFPQKNRLNLIIPDTTTKYSMRSEYMYQRIAEICANITNLVPGNSAIFFPSYYMRDQINLFFSNLSKRTAFVEVAGMTKNERADVLENFKKYKDSGAVLLGVSSGSFGEGVDLPGDLLKCVIVVGLPLNSPDLETEQLIAYFDKKFGKGWDYGYIFPAFNKTLQNAGRCIRSEKDKGIVVFLDERYSWPRYVKLFPEELLLKITKNYENKISDFFEL